MTDYTKITDFAAKDSLPAGDTGKIIRGSEFETEFDNIADAVNSKANTASPTFTGTVTVPTADINGGAIDNTTIGASVSAAGTFSALTVGALSFPTTDGTNGQALVTDGSGSLSLANVEAGIYTATADGAVALNDSLILNTDGTVTAVSGTNPVLGTVATWPASWEPNWQNVIHDTTNNKFVAFESGSGGGYVVFSISGSTVTFGTEGTISGSGTFSSAVFDSSTGRIVYTRGDEAYSASVSGTTLSFSSATDISALSGTYSEERMLGFDGNVNKPVIVWIGYNRTASGFGYYIYDYETLSANVLTVDSGTGAITVGTVEELVDDAGLGAESDVLAAGASYYRKLKNVEYDPGSSQSFVVWYERVLSSENIYGMTMSISGTTITAGGTENDLSGFPEFDPAQYFYDSTNSKLFACHVNPSSAPYDLKATIVTISGAGITLSTSQTIIDGNADFGSFGTGYAQSDAAVAYDADNDNYRVLFNLGDNKIRVATFSLSGSTFTTDTNYADILDLYREATATNGFFFYDTASDKFVVYGGADSYDGTASAQAFSTGTSNIVKNKFIGFSQGTYADGETVRIKIQSAIDSNFTGLTPGSLYYIQADGTIGTTSTGYGVQAGVALSATELLVKGRQDS